MRHRQSQEASILWSHHEETRELPGERDNARNNTRCMQARKATHGLDGQRQDVDRTLRGRVNQNDRGQRLMEKVRSWCGQPSDRRVADASINARSSAIAEGPRDASCQLKSCQLPRNSAETTYTTSPDQINGMKLEI